MKNEIIIKDWDVAKVYTNKGEFYTYATILSPVNTDSKELYYINKNGKLKIVMSLKINKPIKESGVFYKIKEIYRVNVNYIPTLIAPINRDNISNNYKLIWKDNHITKKEISEKFNIPLNELIIEGCK